MSSFRTQAKLVVSLSPGIHVRRLQKVLGVSFSTVRYHVESLERDGEIVRFKDGRYDRLFPADTAENMRGVYAALQSKTSRRVLAAMVATGQGPMQNGEISGRTHVPRSTVSECLARLSEVGLVKRALTPEGLILFDVSERERAIELLAIFRGKLSLAADRFIDLWEI